MMQRGVMAALLAVAMAALAAGCANQPAPPEDAAKGKARPSAQAADASRPLKIAVIPKATMHIFWKSVRAGAAKAAADLPNVGILWQGPAREDDRRDQIDLVETFIQKRVDAIVLAPLDDKALVASVRKARDAGITVVIFDSDLADPEAYVSFVATDNYKGGVIGARRLAEVLGDKGKVILLRYQVGSASNENREQGFLEEMRKHPNIRVVSSDQHSGPTVESAMTAAQSLLTKFGEGQVDGIFCPNEPVSTGMLQALATAGRAGKVAFVGFDASPRLVEAMHKDHISGLVVQDPFKIGYEGVRTAVLHLRGQKVERRVDTGVTLVTPENLTDPDIHRLVHPPLE
jgi:ribose transport system substrate-binding protein